MLSPCYLFCPRWREEERVGNDHSIIQPFSRNFLFKSMVMGVREYAAGKMEAANRKLLRSDDVGTRFAARVEKQSRNRLFISLFYCVRLIEFRETDRIS